MDTRAWGPSGWALLHLIASSPFAGENKRFWELLPFVLPCKFCRASLTDYYEIYPIPEKGEAFDIWLYKIHNCVNKKLRDQGQRLDPDPPMESVLKRYSDLLEQGCTKTQFPGWEFLFCIADNHPGSSPSVPMPDVPKILPTTLKEKNRYNLLRASERKIILKEFWKTIGDVLPFEEWRISWKKYAGPVTRTVESRKSALSWLWKIRCGLDKDLRQMHTDTFHGLCKTIANYRSGCSTSKTAKTCRRIRKRASKRNGMKTRSVKQR
jgi:hypothetical protein